MFTAIDIYNGPETFASTVAEVPRSSMLLYAAHMCLAEVHNGGFLQFFWNNTGVLAPEAVEGFTVVGMPKMAALVTEAARPLGSPYPRDREERWDALVSASGHTVEDMERFVKKSDNLYIAFVEATKTLPFNELEKQFWETAESENDGFQEAATRYAQSLNSVQ